MGKGKNGNGILSGEIRSLQALARRVAEKGEDPNMGLEDLLKIVEFHGRACTRLATLMVNGCMCQANANVDLPAGLFSGGAATWYVFAVRSAGSTSFTLSVNTAATEAPDQRIIGEVAWDGANIVSVRDYFASALSVADYDSGWFAVAYNNTYTKAHGLNQNPRMVVAEHSANADGSGEIVPLVINYGANFLSAISYDATNVYLVCQNNGSLGVIASGRRLSGSGYVRIRAWR